jgi:imidazole glycerol-phosphate synthase subunit HisH
MIVIIDYGMGNLRSINKAFERLNIQTMISSKKKDIEEAEKLILPGVGHFGNGIKNLKDLDIIDTLQKRVKVDKIPILGICLGLQLFTNSSEEGNVNGLGFIEAKSIRFNFEDKNNNLKIPHMGWNTVKINKSNSLLNSVNDDEYFYFVHSYHVLCENKEDILTTTFYGYEFTSAIQKENIFGTQFHPEKSHSSGLKILQNFSQI